MHEELEALNAVDGSVEETMSIRGRSVRGRRLKNPYGIENMRQVYVRLTEELGTRSGDEPQLAPNAYHMQITIEEYSDMDTLKSLGFEVFDYPLDFYPVEEDLDSLEVIVDTTGCVDIPVDDLALPFYVYTVAESPTEIPSYLESMVLEECYIPDDSEEGGEGIQSISVYTRASGEAGTFSELLEREAIRSADLPDGFGLTEEIRTRASSYSPAGRIQLQDATVGLVPVKGVKVRCRYFVKVGVTHTNANGYYSFVGIRKWSSNPYYQIQFSNVKGFDIWGNWLFLTPATWDLGHHSRLGFDYTFQRSGQGWRWPIINNAAYEYYEMCFNTGILPPPADLKIWSLGNITQSSSAPMLRRVPLHMVGTWIPTLATIFSGGNGAILTTISMILTFGLPDVFIGTSGALNYHYIYGSVWHELSHTSHFRKVGALRWGTYIEHTVESVLAGNGNYGSPLSCNDNSTGGAGLCGVSESWAYAHENWYFRHSGANLIAGNNQWFTQNRRVLDTLMQLNLLTPAQIYAVMGPDVESISDFQASLIEYYQSPNRDISSIIYEINR